MDLFEPGSGSRVHDFTGGVQPSGLVWTVPIADDTVVVTREGKQLDVDVHDVAVIDSTSAGDAPAVVSFQMTWRGRGAGRLLGKGGAVPPSDPAGFSGRFFRARAKGTFSGTSGTFTFASNPRRRAHSIFAELGTEQTGALLPAASCARCGRVAPVNPDAGSRW